MIRKVYEANPLTCIQCGATMKIIAFLTDYPVVDRIINHFKLSFVAERPPPPHIAYQELLVAGSLIYHPQRWAEATLILGVFIKSAQQKRSFLFFRVPERIGFRNSLFSIHLIIR